MQPINSRKNTISTSSQPKLSHNSKKKKVKEQKRENAETVEDETRRKC
jgi:hypothetical protein